MRGLKWLPLVALAAVLIALAPGARDTSSIADACAFPNAPDTYETTEDRNLYNAAMDLAGHDMLFTGDPFFSQRSIGIGLRNSRTASNQLYVPPTLMKAIAWIESRTTQASSGVPFGSVGPVLVSFDCGHGIGQVTSGMTAPLGENGRASNEQALVGTHYAYNIGRSMAILVDKWNAAPAGRPIVGLDTNSDPKVVENWYYAVWGYNGFTGPGANRSNHPLDPIYGGWPRTPYSCGPSNDGLSHNRALHPYQELVYGCMAHPPTVQGRPLWRALDATLPDLNNPYWRTPLDVANFVFPYAKMDMATPKPQHEDPTPRPHALARLAVLGQPRIAVDRPIVVVGVRPNQSATGADLAIFNAGSGVLPWRVTANRPWVTVSEDAGVALGGDVPCAPGCARNATLRISVDPRQILGSDAAVVRIEHLGIGGGVTEVALFVRVNVALGVPGTSKN
jgi:hypothetical protein